MEENINILEEISGKWKIDYSELSNWKQIGEGSFGKVYLANFKGMKRVCIKLLLDDIEGLTKSELEVYIKREILVLKEIGTHPNITKLLGITINDNKILLVMEYASGGDLTKKLFDRNIDLNWEQRIQFAKDIANALLFLHSKNIVHRDLKPVNLLIKSPEDWTILTCDFGFARKIDNEEFMTICGSDSHMAPEIKLGDKYDSKADIYSYGIVLSELITRTPAKPRTNNEPFEVDSFKQFAESIECPKPLLDLVIECINNDPEKRPDSSVIIKKLEKIKMKGEESSESDTLSDSEENKEEESSKPENPGQKTPRKKKAIKKRIKKKAKVHKKEENEEGNGENESENPPKKTASTKKTTKRVGKSKTSKKAPGTLEKEVKIEEIIEVTKEERVDIVENKVVETEIKNGTEKNKHKEENANKEENVEKVEEKIKSKKEKKPKVDVVEDTPKIESKNVEVPIQNTLLEKTPLQGIKGESSKKSESTPERNRRMLLSMKSIERIDILKHRSDSESNTSSENLKPKKTPVLTSTQSEMTITQRGKRPDRTPKKKTSSKMVTLTSVKGHSSDHKEELSFSEGEKIIMVELDHTGWVFGKANKKYGWFPLECVNFSGEKKSTSTLFTTPKEEPKDIQKKLEETPILSEKVESKEKKTKKQHKSKEKDISIVSHVEPIKEEPKIETEEIKEKVKEVKETIIEIKEEPKVEVKVVEIKESTVEIKENKVKELNVEKEVKEYKVEVKEVTEEKIEVEIKQSKLESSEEDTEEKIEIKEEIKVEEKIVEETKEEKIDTKKDHKHKHHKEDSEDDDNSDTEHSDSSDTDESEEKVVKEEKVVERVVEKVIEKEEEEIPKVEVERVVEEKVVVKDTSPRKEKESEKKESEKSSSEDTSTSSEEEEKKNNFDKDLIKHAEGLEEGNKKISVFDAILSGGVTTRTMETPKEKEEENIVWVSDFHVIEDKKKEHVLKKRPEHTPKKKVSSKNLPMTSTKAYKSEEKEELSFPEGSRIFMIEIDPSGWVFGKYNKSYGWFPIECVNHDKEGSSSSYRGSLLISTPNANNLENDKLNSRKSMFVSLSNDVPSTPKGNQTENETKNTEISENKTLPIEENKQETTNTEEKGQYLPTSFPPISSDEQLLNKVIIQLRDLEGSMGKNKKMLTTFENSILAQKIVSHITATCGGEKEALQLCQTLENRGVIEQSQKKKASKFSPKEFYHINLFRPELAHLNKAKQWEGETGNPLQISAEILRKLVILVDKHKPKFITDVKSLKEFCEIEISACALQKAPLKDLDGQERMLFFVNVRNILILHYQINKGCPKNLLERKDQAQAAYLIDGNIYTVEYIEETILKGITPPTNTDPRRNNVSKFPTNILVFSLCDCTVSTPKPFWFVSSSSYREILTENVSKFLQGEFGIDESYLHSNNKLELPKLLKGVFEPNEIVKNIKPYLSEKTRKLIEQIEKAVELDLSYKNSSFQSCFELK